MGKISILHLITAAKNASPFDVNMAFDAGFNRVMPYTNVLLSEVMGLTQDAMFSRRPSNIKYESIFIGGRDVHVAIEMQQIAQSAMFAPFVMSTMADPSGSFTTAAAMLAKINQHLNSFNQTLAQQTVAIFGASGTVGTTSALIAAKQGATVQLVAYRDVVEMQLQSDDMHKRYGYQFQVVDGTNDTVKTKVLETATVAICAASAGVCVLEDKHFAQSKTLKVVADVNAVAPSGAAGIADMSDGTKINNTNIIGIGALTIGRLKYVTQQKLLQQMLTGEKIVHLAFDHAFEVACANLAAIGK